MEIRVIDFEILTKHYQKYREGVDNINKEKDSFLEKLEPLKKEMNKIISVANSGLIVDPTDQQNRIEEFQRLQQEAVDMDNEFKYKMKNMRDELNSKSYDELSAIISEWAVENSIDIVSGKMEIVYANDKFDSTNDILEILKQKNLFVDELVKEKESV
jgi:Skp family chaperone for outer membrane proteins